MTSLIVTKHSDYYLFRPVIIFRECFLLSLYREADDGCKKQMERLLNIWKERTLYRADFIQQLKLAIEDSNSPRPPGQIKKKQKHCLA